MDKDVLPDAQEESPNVERGRQAAHPGGSSTSRCDRLDANRRSMERLKVILNGE